MKDKRRESEKGREEKWRGKERVIGGKSEGGEIRDREREGRERGDEEWERKEEINQNNV